MKYRLSRESYLQVVRVARWREIRAQYDAREAAHKGGRIGAAADMASPVSAYHSAMSLLSQNKFSDGATALQAVIERGGLPKELMPDAKANLGTALSAMGRATKAVIPFRSAVNMRPTNGQYRYNIALSFAEMGNAAAAETEYREAARLGPKETPASAYNNLGNMLVTSGRRDGAIELFRSAVQMNPQNAMGHNNLANLLRDGGDAASLRAAGRHYSSAIQLSPRYLEAYKNLGNLLKERQEWRYHAARAYRIALQLVPSPRVRCARVYCSTLEKCANGWGRTGRRMRRLRTASTRTSGSMRSSGRRISKWAWPQNRGGIWRASCILLSEEIALTLIHSNTAARGPCIPRARHINKWHEGLLSIRQGRRRRVVLAQDGFRPYYSAALASGNWTDVTLALSGIRQPGAALAPESYALYESLGEAATTMVMGSAYFSGPVAGRTIKSALWPDECALTNTHWPLSVFLLRAGDACRQRDA